MNHAKYQSPTWKPHTSRNFESETRREFWNPSSHAITLQCGREEGGWHLIFVHLKWWWQLVVHLALICNPCLCFSETFLSSSTCSKVEFPWIARGDELGIHQFSFHSNNKALEHDILVIPTLLVKSRIFQPAFEGSIYPTLTISALFWVLHHCCYDNLKLWGHKHPVKLYLIVQHCSFNPEPIYKDKVTWNGPGPSEHIWPRS